MRKIFILLALASAWQGWSLPSVALAAAPQSPQVPIGINNTDPKLFISSLLEKGIGLLSDKSKPQQQIEEEFRNILNRCFDVKSIASFTLGRARRGQPVEKLNEYLKLFEAMIFRVYMDQLQQLSITNYQITGIKVDSEGAQKVISIIARHESPQPVTVEWILYKKDNGYLVFDVIIDSVSLSIMQQKEISAILTRHGNTLDGLLEELRSRYGASLR